MKIKSVTEGFAVVTAFVSACSGEMVVDSSSGAVERWMGNGQDCPADPVTPDAQCSVAEGQICAWNYADPYNQGYFAYRACSCQEASGGITKWHCFDSLGGMPALCPDVQPEQGSSCFGFAHTECKYPRS